MNFSVLSRSVDPTLGTPGGRILPCSLSWGFSRENTRVICQALLRGSFQAKIKPRASYVAGEFYYLESLGSLRILELIAYAFLGEFPHPGIELGSCIEGDSLPADTREAQS